MNNALTQFGPDTETAFFPVPESMRRRKERRRRMQQDLIGAAFTGVPRGFYRAYGMRSPLDLAPSTPGNPEETAERMSELEGRVEERVEEAVDAAAVEANNVDLEEDRFEEGPLMRQEGRKEKRSEAERLRAEMEDSTLGKKSNLRGAEGKRKRNKPTPTKVVGGKAGKERLAKE